MKTSGPQQQSVSLWGSCRLTLAVFGFFAFFCAYSQRVCMSVAILCMVNQTALYHLHTINIDEVQTSTSIPSVSNMLNVTNALSVDDDSDDDLIGLPPPECRRNYETTENQTTDSDGSFVWEKPLQGHILGAFFYGYLVSQIPGGLLAERFGGKWVFFIFLLVSTISTLLTPLAAQVDPIFLIVVRIMCGLGSGGLFPAMHTILSRWSPPDQRSKLACYTYSGTMAGNVISFPVAGLLCKYGFGEGWPSIFYVSGMASCLALVLWVIFIYSTPHHHPRISTAEKYLIINALDSQHHDEQQMSTPWSHILTSPAVWAIVIANVTTDWGLYTFLTNIPTYMYEVLYFDIAKNGFLSALPFIGVWIVVLTSPIAADKLISSDILSVNWTRKLMNSIGTFGGAVFVLCLAFFSCSQAYLAVATLTMGVAISGFISSGYHVNHIDIAPRYAGTLYGIANCLASLTGFAAPYTVAVLTPNQTQEEWRRVFYISAAIYVFGGLFFLIFSRGTVQKWARPSTEEATLQPEYLQPLDAKSARA